MGTREGREKGGVSRKRKGGVALAMEGVAHLEDRLGMKCWQGRPGRESWYLLDLIHLFCAYSVPEQRSQHPTIIIPEGIQ